MVGNGNMPVRGCTGCRTARLRQDLLRYVRDGAGRLVVDPWQHHPGRGAYTCAKRACIVLALQRGGFERSFKARICSEVDGVLARWLVALDQAREALLRQGLCDGRVRWAKASARPASMMLSLALGEERVSVVDRQLAERLCGLQQRQEQLREA